MVDVRRQRRSGQRSGSKQKSTALNFADPKAIEAWLARLDSATQDIIAAAEDQVRPLGQRDLGRRAARAIVSDSASSIGSLIASARSGLPAA